MISVIKNNFLSLIILLLLGMMFLQRCDGGKNTPLESPKITRDTIWIKKDSTIYSKPQLIKTIPVNVNHDFVYTQYLPDTNYGKLIEQYNQLLDRYLEKKIYKDSARVDTNGYVITTDTVSQNQIFGRNYRFHLEYPIIKETITLPAKRVNQIYIGGQIAGNPSQLVRDISVGMLFKNKKDQIFGGSIGIDNAGELRYGVQSFWKISLKKK